MNDLQNKVKEAKNELIVKVNTIIYCCEIYNSNTNIENDFTVDINNEIEVDNTIQLLVKTFYSKYAEFQQHQKEMDDFYISPSYNFLSTYLCMSKKNNGRKTINKCLASLENILTEYLHDKAQYRKQKIRFAQNKFANTIKSIDSSSMHKDIVQNLLNGNEDILSQTEFEKIKDGLANKGDLISMFNNAKKGNVDFNELVSQIKVGATDISKDVFDDKRASDLLNNIKDLGQFKETINEKMNSFGNPMLGTIFDQVMSKISKT